MEQISNDARDEKQPANHEHLLEVTPKADELSKHDAETTVTEYMKGWRLHLLTAAYVDAMLFSIRQINNLQDYASAYSCLLSTSP